MTASPLPSKPGYETHQQIGSSTQKAVLIVHRGGFETLFSCTDRKEMFVPTYFSKPNALHKSSLQLNGKAVIWSMVTLGLNVSQRFASIIRVSASLTIHI